MVTTVLAMFKAFMDDQFSKVPYLFIHFKGPSRGKTRAISKYSDNQRCKKSG
jgi:hypothetical protein